MGHSPRIPLKSFTNNWLISWGTITKTSLWQILPDTASFRPLRIFFTGLKLGSAFTAPAYASHSRKPPRATYKGHHLPFLYHSPCKPDQIQLAPALTADHPVGPLEGSCDISWASIAMLFAYLLCNFVYTYIQPPGPNPLVNKTLLSFASFSVEPNLRLKSFISTVPEEKLL